MDQALQLALSSLINQFLAAVKEGYQFAQVQVPDVIHQFLVMTVISDACWLGAGLLILLFGISCFCIEIHADKEGKSEGGFAVVGFIATLISLPFFFVNIKDILTIWLAPKAWLLQYAADLIKTGTGH